MGPRLGGRGKQARPSGVQRRAIRFNGATARRPWKEVLPDWTWVMPGASMGPRLGGRGKETECPDCEGTGEASMGPRLGGRGKRRQSSRPTRHQLASMGPRLGGRGKTPRRWPRRSWNDSLQWGHGSEAVESCSGRRRSSRALRSFNGATARRPWKAPRPSCFFAYSSGFNGATARRPWKDHRRTDLRSTHAQLQWGHGSEAVESAHHGRPRTDREGLQWGHGSEAVESDLILMVTEQKSWLQWGHGSEAVERRPARWSGASMTSSFNGATARRPWKGRGRPKAPDGPAKLQWGHGSEAVERTVVGR